MGELSQGGENALLIRQVGSTGHVINKPVALESVGEPIDDQGAGAERGGRKLDRYGADLLDLVS